MSHTPLPQKEFCFRHIFFLRLSSLLYNLPIDCVFFLSMIYIVLYIKLGNIFVDLVALINLPVENSMTHDMA